MYKLLSEISLNQRIYFTQTPYLIRLDIHLSTRIHTLSI
jgi:hypothetical protein